MQLLKVIKLNYYMKNNRLYLIVAIVTVTILFTVGCKKNNDILRLGQNYQGGIIFYFLEKGDPNYDKHEQHGFVAAPIDQPNYYFWEYNFQCSLIGTNTKIGTGSMNTMTIVINTSSGAALACDKLVLNGYSDWYLPSKDELKQLYKNRYVVGGFSDECYWSSSESLSNQGSWAVNFFNGDTIVRDKMYSYSVRAIRSF